jgi:nitrate reductase delta subunit
MFGLTRRAGAVDARSVWAACAALLDYPTPALLDSLDGVAALVPAERGLQGLIRHLRDTPLGDLQQQYVETFDHTRRCALYLTYFSYGDTRRRGTALLRFKQAYRDAGLTWDDVEGELPDHLCAVLQLGALADAGAARQLLQDHRAGLEMLRLALADWRGDDGSVGSPWHAVIAAVCHTLPELRGGEADAVRRLVEQGPPAEEVGLDGYGAIDPAPVIATSIPVGAPR